MIGRGEPRVQGDTYESAVGERHIDFGVLDLVFEQQTYMIARLETETGQSVRQP